MSVRSPSGQNFSTSEYVEAITQSKHAETYWFPGSPARGSRRTARVCSNEQSTVRRLSVCDADRSMFIASRKTV